MDKVDKIGKKVDKAEYIDTVESKNYEMGD